MKLNLFYLIFFILINFSNSQNINRNNLDSDVEITTESVYLMDNSGNISMNINVWGAVDRPGRLIVKEGVNLITVLSMVGGAKTGVDYSNIIIIRDLDNTDVSQKITIDMTSFFKNGNKSNIIKILPNDTIIFRQKYLYFFLSKMTDLTTMVSIITLVYNLIK